MHHTHLSRHPTLQTGAEMILMPYNYVVDPTVREKTLPDFDWKSSVIII